MENPIPFAPLRSTRVMSTAYLHALYCRLLLLPRTLSCDWSYACVPLVEQLTGGACCSMAACGPCTSDPRLRILVEQLAGRVWVASQMSMSHGSPALVHADWSSASVSSCAADMWSLMHHGCMGTLVLQALRLRILVGQLVEYCSFVTVSVSW